jgi:uncharacterized protein YdhG (YjbR/CyaY superfamily)
VPRQTQTSKTAIADFASYARRFPRDVQELLGRVRSTITQAVPAATETISYNMPAFKLHGKVIVYFAAFKTHIGLYPPVRTPAALKRAVAVYAGPKRSLQFPCAQPIPYELIAHIARARAAEAAPRAARDS